MSASGALLLSSALAAAHVASSSFLAAAAAALAPGGVDLAVVVDPPRAGLSGAMRGALRRSTCSVLVYVSCDAQTLGRDLAALCGAATASPRLQAAALALLHATASRLILSMSYVHEGIRQRALGHRRAVRGAHGEDAGGGRASRRL